MKKNYFLAKWLNNELSDEELAEFVSSPDFEKYQKIKKYTEALEVGEIDESAMLQNILHQKKSTPKVISLYKKWAMRVAAILVLALGISMAFEFLQPKKQIAEFGNTVACTLPDNSQVILNAGSEIKYKKWKWDTNRNIDLKGEAYFKVAKGRRFEVTTNLGKVAVLGTQFNVKSRKNRFDVSCYEGRVKVNYRDMQIILTHGQSVTFENGTQTNNLIKVQEPEWINQQLAFNKENIQNLLEEVQRQYNINIELKTKDTNALFTGKLPAKNLDQALQIIGTTYNLKATKVSENKIIFEEK